MIRGYLKKWFSMEEKRIGDFAYEVLYDLDGGDYCTRISINGKTKELFGKYETICNNLNAFRDILMELFEEDESIEKRLKYLDQTFNGILEDVESVYYISVLF